ncbi:MAG: FAD-binding oxidoreductase [Elusimicrobiota bacterium]
MSRWAALKKRISSKGAVLTDIADLAVYSRDAGPDRARPEAVVLAGTTEDAAQTVRFCLDHGIPYTARGAGTNLSGGAVPLSGGVVISLARLSQVLAVDTQDGFVEAEPGAINISVQKELSETGFFYAPDPASYRVSTIGGNIAENAGGPRCLKYGVTTHHVRSLQAVMPDGTMETFSAADSGPDVMSLLIGSEGTLGLVTRARLDVIPVPSEVQTFLAGFKSLDAAMECVSDIVRTGIVPRAMEAMDARMIELIEAHVHAGYPRAAAALLIELDGLPLAVREEGEVVSALCRKHGTVGFRSASEGSERDKLWEGRRGAYAAMARLAPNVLVEDGVVPRQNLSAIAARIQEIANRSGIDAALLFHAGDGNIHPHLPYDERDHKGASLVRTAGEEILRACVELGGSISGEHGIGSDKRLAMARAFDPAAIKIFSHLKSALDPGRLANPGKIVPSADEMSEAPSWRSPRALSASARLLSEKVRLGAPAVHGFAIIGSGSKSQRHVDPDLLELQTTGLDHVMDADRANMTVTSEAGISLERLHWELARSGLFLNIPKGPGTLGGFLAAKAWPPARRDVLGIRVILADGEVADFGGKTVKNVAGYDVPRLFLGSWGAFGIIIDATLKAYVRPQKVPERTADPIPFMPGKWQRRIKHAFDPDNRFNPWIFRT